jgi:large subunit ribosomal protein L17
MRHRQKGRKLGRDTEHRIAMWRNMAVSLFTHGQITTTIPKAKSIKPFVEKLISAAKKGDLASRRRVIKQLGGDPILLREEDDEDVPRNKYGEIVKEGGRRQGPRLVKYLFDEIGPRYADRNGGYTRIIKLGTWRKGDGADLCVLQLVGEEESGPQVGGRYSRRRNKADRRMQRAAELRKARSGGTGAESAETGVATATAEPESAQATEQASAEESSNEDQKQPQDQTAGDEQTGEQQGGDEEQKQS